VRKQIAEIWHKIKYKTDRRDKLLILFSLLTVCMTIGIAFLIPFDLKTYSGFGYGGIFLITALNASATFSPLPTYLLPVVAAQYLNPVLVVIVAAGAAMIGETVKYWFGDGIDKVVRDYRWHKWLSRWFYRSPFLFLVVWIALPNPVQSLGQVFAGSAEYPFWKYAIASFIGNAIWFTMTIQFGSWIISLGLHF
jgi:membrane protein DedA with SNARE-associated domain